MTISANFSSCENSLCYTICFSSPFLLKQQERAAGHLPLLSMTDVQVQPWEWWVTLPKGQMRTQALTSGFLVQITALLFAAWVLWKWASDLIGQWQPIAKFSRALPACCCPVVTWWEYLHHSKWHMLQIGTCTLPNPAVATHQHAAAQLPHLWCRSNNSRESCHTCSQMLRDYQLLWASLPFYMVWSLSVTTLNTGQATSSTHIGNETFKKLD